MTGLGALGAKYSMFSFRISACAYIVCETVQSWTQDSYISFHNDFITTVEESSLYQHKHRSI